MRWIGLIIVLVLWGVNCFAWYMAGRIKSSTIYLGATGHLTHGLMDKVDSGAFKTVQDINLAQAKAWEEWMDVVTNDKKLKAYYGLYKIERKVRGAAKGLITNKENYGTPGDFNQT